MPDPVLVYREVVAGITTETPGFIIGCSDPKCIALSILPCSDKKIAEEVCLAGLSIIGRYGDDITNNQGLTCLRKNNTLHWTLDGISIEPVLTDGNPFADFVVLFTSFSRNIASSVGSPRYCRVFDEILEIGDSIPCQKLLPKKWNPVESLAHPFSFQAINRVLPIDILLQNAPELVTAPQLLLSHDVSHDVIDVIVVVKPELDFASAFQLLLSEVKRIAALPGLRNHHYYGLPNMSLPVSISNNSDVGRYSAAFNYQFNPIKALRFECLWTKRQRLFNVHRFVRPSGLVDNKQYLVNGAYGYYHYLQDGINDDGWGCAYRSLQTLWSWAYHQGHTSEPVPDFTSIQKIICDHDDKPKAFIGSKQWIGAIEVSCALSSVGVVCKILPLHSGAEFATKGRELSQHFQLHGSPVMIGGGVLAYTLLGIDMNEFTGDLRFLILDPHYKGDDDIDVIIKNGWCAWRSSDLFDQTVFYNLCMPQKPAIKK